MVYVLENFKSMYTKKLINKVIADNSHIKLVYQRSYLFHSKREKLLVSLSPKSPVFSARSFYKPTAKIRYKEKTTYFLCCSSGNFELF